MGTESHLPFTLPVYFMLRKGDVFQVDVNTDGKCSLPQILVRSPLYAAQGYVRGHVIAKLLVETNPLQVVNIQSIHVIVHRGIRKT